VEVIDSIKESIEALGDAPISVNMASFAKLIEEIEKAEEEGISFTTKPLPEPAELLE
jgi:5,10-methylenetetrahydrofolate reductase